MRRKCVHEVLGPGAYPGLPPDQAAWPQNRGMDDDEEGRLMIPEHLAWSLEVEEASDGIRLRFRGERVRFDLPNSQALGDQLTNVLADRGGCKLYLDLANVAYLNGSALARLIVVHQRLQLLGGSLILINASPFINEIFAITRLNRYLDIRTPSKTTAEQDESVPEPAII